MSRDPGDLLARFRAGDEQAFAELVGEMGPRLKGYFLRLGAPEIAAEDLTQNVFLRVLQGVERYREAGRLDAFLLRIARNLWIDHRRRRQPAAAPDGQLEVGDPDPGPLERSAGRERAERVRAALAQLDEATRELLELAVLQQLPYREVGEILGIPVGTVKSRVFYALRRLRLRLAGLDPAAGEDGS